MNAAVTRPPENRYLFILETSKEMKREGEAAQNVLLQLIYSGVVGQMRAGDTFGIWTYNDTLRAGDYPMQTFTREDREWLTSRASDYVKSLKFTGGAHLENALLPMLKLATNSPNLTVILISDGKQAVVGTPFDQEIRALHKKYYDELHESKLPFITVLVAYKGEFINYAVNSALGPIRIPRVPTPPPPTNAVVKVETVAPTNRVIKRPEPLILRGALPKKNTTETASTPAAPPVEPVKESAHVQPAIEASTTNATTQPSPTQETAVSNAQTTTAVAVAPTPQAITPPLAAPVPTPSVVTPEPAKEQTSNPATFTVLETNKAAVVETKTPTVESTPPPAVAPANPLTQVSTEVAVVNHATSQPAVAEPKAAEPTPKSELTEKVAAPPVTPIVAQTEGPSTLKIALIAISVLLLLILIVLILMLKKSKQGQPSLISQSINKTGP